MKKTTWEELEKQGWICTDPDNFQFCKEVSYLEFTYKEFDQLSYDLSKHISSSFLDNDVTDFLTKCWNIPSYWIEMDINVNDYSDEQKSDCVSGYYTKQEFEDMLKNREYQLIAECIFEIESGQY